MDRAIGLGEIGQAEHGGRMRKYCTAIDEHMNDRGLWGRLKGVVLQVLASCQGV